MKRIVGGKKYDTDTAKYVGSDAYSTPGDFNWWEEALYRKKTGEFFLCAAGGPATCYARRSGQNEWSSGEEIIPFTNEEAKEWVEKHLSGDKYEEIFGEVEE